ncbi:MAG: Bifunctional NAD(P)H-hydrate repair enzyme Nnr [Elusimicrobia bacterium]|nr:Bifunctional NAD(P)H-hydrate repair enzyme Nnr [Elusimicrobiota bacterium]
MKTKILTVDQSRQLDKKAQTEFDIPLLILMENAGHQLAEHIRLALIPPINQCQVVILAGKGNNGGDTFVAARHLLQKNIRSQIFLVGDESELKAEAEINFRIIRKLGLSVEPLSAIDRAQNKWDRLPVLIVDGILGTGFTPPLKEPVTTAIRWINKFKKNHNCNVKVLAVDIPSGLHGDNGPIEQDIVRADLTITFACFKPGLLKSESKNYVGRLEVVDIGIPETLTQEAV